MLFVADSIPSELRRVIEFLNEQMDPAEVLAVEIKQYVGDNLKTLVPRVYGQKIVPTPTKRWNEASFFHELQKNTSAEAVTVAKNLFNWAKCSVAEIWWGSGKKYGSFIPYLHHKNDHTLFLVWTSATIEICFRYYSNRPPFNSEDKRREILDKLNKIEGIKLSEDSINGSPNIPLEKFSDTDVLKELTEVFEWMISAIKAT